ncbi:MAG TPA: thioredoxin family protein [Bacillota bacterium]|nr:thioredoxin family protein [Bacillota bacterium]
MRNKMLAIVGIIVVLFIALYFLNDYKNNKNTGEDSNDEENLYGNQIKPDDLRAQIDSGDPMTVYFYSPDCVHCQRTTPVLVPLTEEKGIDMKKLNLKEYKRQWDEYKIEGTPTLIHYDDGEEVARISGEQSEENFTVFFDEYVLNDSE